MKRNPFWIGCEWTVFHLCYYDHHHNSVDPYVQEEALPQLRILLQIRRVGFILSVNIFLIFMIYLAFSKFGQLRIGTALSLNLNFLVCNVIQCGNGDWIVVLEYFRAYLSF
jgi:hypothetical protein